MNESPAVDRETLVRRHTLIWISMMVGVGLYAGVAWFLVKAGQVGRSPGLPAGALLWTAAVGVVLLGAGLAVVRRSEEPDARTPAGGRAARYSALRIVGLALQEAAGILTITVSLLVARADWAMAAGIAAVAVMALARPSEEHLRRLER